MLSIPESGRIFRFLRSRFCKIRICTVHKCISGEVIIGIILRSFRFLQHTAARLRLILRGRLSRSDLLNYYQYITIRHLLFPDSANRSHRCAFCRLNSVSCREIHLSARHTIHASLDRGMLVSVSGHIWLMMTWLTSSSTSK